MQARYLGQLRLIFTHKVPDVVLGCVLDMCQLFENTRQDDAVWWHTVLQNQGHLSLKGSKYTTLEKFAEANPKSLLNTIKTAPKFEKQYQLTSNQLRAHDITVLKITKTWCFHKRMKHYAT